LEFIVNIKGGYTMNYEDVFNLSLLKKEIGQGKEELKSGIYDDVYILETIIPASAGIYAYDEFLESLGMPVPGDFDEKNLLVDSLLTEMSNYLNQQMDNILGQDYTIAVEWLDGEIVIALLKEDYYEAGI
jgi:hypothetical protein